MILRFLTTVVLGCLVLNLPGARAADANHCAVQIAAVQGSVEVLRAGTTIWVPAETNLILHTLDHVRCGPNSRVAFFWSDESVVRAGSLTEIEIPPVPSSNAESGLHLIRGVISFFHRDRPGQIEIFTRGAIAGVEGTEFVMSVDAADRTTLAVIDGKVRLGQATATVVLTNGQQAVAALNTPPVRIEGFIANNVLQWCFYYPAVLDLNELPLTPAEQATFAESLAAYRLGDLPTALAKFPGAVEPASDDGKLYFAALLLSAGEVARAESILAAVTGQATTTQRLTTALRVLIAAVKHQPKPASFEPQLATEFLANSYYEQSRAIQQLSLERALECARQATIRSPQCGFAWERLAELEFCFGHTQAALTALNQSLTLAPRNAEALSLKGFLLAADNHTREATTWFDQALAVDSALGNAWLGRGLCRFRLGQRESGRKDLLMAAALEPQRAVLRSYLGKADAQVRDFTRAHQELNLAKQLDPNDPTAWLYLALLDQGDNQINEAIRNLEKSKALNDNRNVYRSQFLLDKDRSVRSANLATLYRDAGMPEVSLNEAGRAVNDDYANYSAHLFLAGSYGNLRDPNQINLRYETPAENEYLVANLLAPASVGTLSPIRSEDEYSRFFVQDGFGVTSKTEYLSRGAWTEAGAQYGVLGDFSYDFESYYRYDPGQRQNADLEQRQLSLSAKQELTSDDSLFLSISDLLINQGDVNQYYAASQASQTARVTEQQEPLIGLGYHHQWSPHSHTLAYFTRLNDTTTFTNGTDTVLVGFIPQGSSQLTSVRATTMGQNYANRLNIYSEELQQILEQPNLLTILGARLQYGHFNTYNRQDSPRDLVLLFPTPAADQNFESLFKRISVYGYQTWQLADALELIGGLTYDHITFPANFRNAPVAGIEKNTSEFSPKAGLIWTPARQTTVRFAYTRSLAGASLDQSYTLEPAQVAGFIQSYRSLIPESVAGANAGAKFETFDLSLEQQFSTGTYLGIAGEILNSKIDRTDGIFDSTFPAKAVPATVLENLDYSEKTLRFSLNQLLGKSWALGLNYRLSQAVLDDQFPGLLNGLMYQNFQPQQHTRGLLHQMDMTAIYNHPSGFYVEGELLWFTQSNSGYSPAEPGDTFWQGNAFIGYRLPGRQVKVSAGLLNLGNQDYHLNPLNLYNELPRTLTFVGELRFNF